LSILKRSWDLEIVACGALGVCRFDDLQKHLGISRKVLSERLKVLQGERERFLAFQGFGSTGKEFAGVFGAGPGDPDGVQHVFEVGVGDLGVVLGHAVADLDPSASPVTQSLKWPLKNV
jgi:hypothetical protein